MASTSINTPNGTVNQWQPYCTIKWKRSEMGGEETGLGSLQLSHAKLWKLFQTALLNYGSKNSIPVNEPCFMDICMINANVSTAVGYREGRVGVCEVAFISL